jgi:hypothetical protein
MSDLIFVAMYLTYRTYVCRNITELVVDKISTKLTWNAGCGCGTREAPDNLVPRLN